MAVKELIAQPPFVILVSLSLTVPAFALNWFFEDFEFIGPILALLLVLLMLFSGLWLLFAIGRQSKFYKRKQAVTSFPVEMHDHTTQNSTR